MNDTSRVIAEVDVTDRATAKGWQLPDRVRVIARLLEDPRQEHPRQAGDVYNTDVDEVDYTKPTHGFCRHCREWMRLIEEQWVTVNGGRARCPALDGDPDTDTHVLDDPVCVRMWAADEWAFGIVEVVVTDDSGVEWGGDSLAGVEYGTFPYEINRETGAVSCRNIDPLNDPHHPVPEMIDAALHEAVDSPQPPTPPVIIAPATAEEGSRA